METGIEGLSLGLDVHGHGGDILLDMDTLTQYSGTGRCCQVVVADETRTKSGEKVKMWAEKMGWRIEVEKCNVIIIERTPAIKHPSPLSPRQAWAFFRNFPQIPRS